MTRQLQVDAARAYSLLPSIGKPSRTNARHTITRSKNRLIAFSRGLAEQRIKGYPRSVALISIRSAMPHIVYESVSYFTFLNSIGKLDEFASSFPITGNSSSFRSHNHHNWQLRRRINCHLLAARVDIQPRRRPTIKIQGAVNGEVR